MTRVALALEQVAHGGLRVRLNALGTLALWIILGFIVASGVLYYVPVVAQWWMFVLGGFAGILALLLVKSL